MRIRSVTLGTNVSYPLREGVLDELGSFSRLARSRFAAAGFEVQTVRLAIQPFPRVLQQRGSQAAVSLARGLEGLCQERQIDYCSLGTVDATQPDADLSFIDVIPDVIRHTTHVFCSVLVAAQGAGINLAAIERAAQAIANIAPIEEGGFGNLRLAVLANCGPGVPFFPASFHGAPDTTFAIATEAANLAVDSFERAATLDEAQAYLREAIEAHGARIVEVCEGLASETDLRFAGIDFSLAPYPEGWRSIGHAVERLGVDVFGGSGTLFATALMTRVLRQARFPRCGFCGLLYPVLEDTVIAERGSEGCYSLDSLLLYSAVCGTGLDTVPLPGDVSVDELAAILLDVATLATVASKPLTARLMPVPGKAAGEMTAFDFPYFCNGRILDVRGRGASRILRDAFVRW